MTVPSLPRDRTRLTGPSRLNINVFRLKDSGVTEANTRPARTINDVKYNREKSRRYSGSINHGSVYILKIMAKEPSQSWRITIALTVLFGISMGYFEAAVVVYLRELYYPGGFSFPLELIPSNIIAVELFREFWSIIMLAAVAGLAGKKFWERFGYFIVMFGVWDILYYVWLRILIGWPESLFDWDILFLIPLPWIGPVIAPVLIALLMIVIGISITLMFDRGVDFRPTKMTWALAVLATLVLLYSFMHDIDAGLYQAEPKPYAYWMLFIGLALYLGAYIVSYRKAVAGMPETE